MVTMVRCTLNMKKWESEIVSPLRHFTYNLISSPGELTRFNVSKLEPKSLSFLIKTQKKLNTYISDFKKVVNPTVRTAIEEETVANLQGKYMTEILSEIPTDRDEINELMSVKVLEAFALHNRTLAINWDHIPYQSD